MVQYLNPAMKQLKDQQIRYAPREVQAAQLDRAERLLWEIERSQSYPYGEICERITSFRAELYPDLAISGEEALHDLRRFVEDLSENIDLEAASVTDDEVWTVEDVSRRYQVSGKTVLRWRERGLPARRFRFGGRKKVGFLRSTVERFVARNPTVVERGASFSQLTELEREKLIRRARRLSRAGAGQTEIARRLGRRFGRSPETVRYTLKNHDQEHPEVAVFPNSTSPLSEDQKVQLVAEFRRGVDVGVLSDKYRRTRTSIYRVVAEVRAQQILEMPIDFMDAEEFHAADADANILAASPPARDGKSGVVKPPPGLPPYLASLYAIPLLTREEEAYYFRRMNFLKYRAAELRKTLDPQRPKTRDMDQIEQWLNLAGEVKNFLIRSNLRLVVSIAKRHVKPNTNFFEMVSDGNMSLIRAIEKFDFTKGFKFSTYASWAIIKNYARSIPAEHTRLDRFRTGNDEVFQNSSDPHAGEPNSEVVNHRQHEAIMVILNRLEPREKEIIVHRYGLSVGAAPQTLEQVGHRFGVTKERIRQLEARALRKLRKIAEAESLEIPGI